jgi:hypothetical protein
MSRRLIAVTFMLVMTTLLASAGVVARSPGSAPDGAVVVPLYVIKSPSHLTRIGSGVATPDNTVYGTASHRHARRSLVFADRRTRPKN